MLRMPVRGVTLGPRIKKKVSGTLKTSNKGS